VGTFASKVLVFLLMPLYTAILSAEEFGVADLISQTANLLIPLASVGICDALFRFTLDAEETDRKKIFTSSMTVLFVGSAALALICGALTFTGMSVSRYLPLITLYVIGANFHSACAHYMRAKGKTVLFAVQGIVNTVLTIALNILFLIVFDMGSTGYVLSVVVADLTITVGLFVGCRMWRELDFKSFDRAMLKNILKFSIPYIPTTMLWLITSVSDRYVVTFYCGTEAQGLYAAASKLPTLVILVSGVFIEAWHFSTVKDASAEERSSFFGEVFKNYMSIMFMGASVLIAGSKILTRLLLADSYYSSWEFVPILVIAMVFSAFSAFFGSVYFLEKKSMLSMVTALAGALINVVLNFVLISKHGAMGAAVATLISYLATYAIRSYDTAHYLKFKQYHIRVIINTAVLIIQALIMINAVSYWKYMQLAILLFMLVFNGKGIVMTLITIAKSFLSKKIKKS
jgi:O-antigen/teichoic acid export membrane protein